MQAGELSCARRELAELRAQNARAKEQIWSASARLRAAGEAMESVHVQRQQLVEAKKLGGDSALQSSAGLIAALLDGNVNTNGPLKLESATSLPALLRRHGQRLAGLQAAVEEARAAEADLRQQLRAETAARGSLEAEVRKLRAEAEARTPIPATSSAYSCAALLQPEKVIIMTSSSLHTLETADMLPNAPDTGPPLVAASGAGSLYSPRPAPTVPMRQLSAGAAPVLLQHLPTNCSNAPPPPIGQQVFRRYSGNGGMMSSRPGPGAPVAGGGPVASGPLLPAPAPGQAALQGRITPQRHAPAQLGVDPRWGYQVPSARDNMPHGALIQAGTRNMPM